MTPRRLGPARALASSTTALLLALALTACGGSTEPTDDDAATSPFPSGSSAPDTPAVEPSDTSGPTAPPAPTATVPSEPTEPTEPTGPITSDAPPLPGSPDAEAAADDWVLALDELVDPSRPAKLRASHIDGGSDLISAIPELDRRTAGATLAFEVSGPEVDGNDGNGQVDVTSDGAPAGTVIGVRFARVDGTWRLTRDGACLLAALVGLTCP